MSGRTRRAVVLLAVASVASTTIAVVAAPGANADTPVTEFSFTSAPGDFIGLGASKSFTPSNASITVGGNSGGVTATVLTATEDWSVTITAPPESQFRPGAYPDAVRSSSPRGAGQAGLDIGGNGHGCNNLFGSLEVFAISADSFGRVIRFDAAFTQHCESAGSPALVGVLKYQAPASAPITATSSNPSVLRDQPVTLSAHVASSGGGGTVSFFDGATPLGTAGVDDAGVADLTTSTLSVGVHTVTASFGAFTSDPFSQTVRDNSVSYWFSSPSSDIAAQGATESFTSPDEIVTFSGSLHEARLRAGVGLGYWSVIIAPPPGQTFAVGDYADAFRTATGTHPGIEAVGVPGATCTLIFGAFNVTDVQADALGNLTEFAATFTQHCETQNAPPLLGTIHYDGSTPTSSTSSTSSTTSTRPPPTRAPVSVSTSAIRFRDQRVGTYGNGVPITITNPGVVSVQLTRLELTGADRFDFFGSTDCTRKGLLRTLAPGASCHAVTYFNPLQRGSRKATVLVADNSGQAARMVSLSGTGTEGFFLAGPAGEVGVAGDANNHGDATHIHLSAPIISIATTPSGAGYWLLARDGGIFSYGNARFHGSTGGTRLNKPIVAMAANRTGKGYRLVGSDGGIFAFGDAQFYGSTGGMHLNKPVDGMAATVDDRGYWLVASDGGIFAFGDAHFYGSAAGRHLTSAVIQITPTPTGRGYWILTANGQLLSYGDAHSYGTATGQLTVGMAATPDGRGYWEVTRDGRIFNFGDAAKYGNIGNLGVDVVVGIAASAPPLHPGSGSESTGLTHSPTT